VKDGTRHRIVQIHPTRRCNLRCRHCYTNSGPEERQELPLALLLSFLTSARAEGYTAISLSGGEPLMYEPLLNVLDHAHSLGMITALTTNGFFLTPHAIESLRGRVDILAISLDGNPSAHNELRGHPRAFDVLLSRLPALRESGMRFGFIFTLTQFNLDQFEWIAQFAVDQGAALVQVHPLEMAGRAVVELSGRVPDTTECLYARIETQRLQKKFADLIHFQCDVVNRRMIEAQRQDFLVGPPDFEWRSRALAELVTPLILEPDGTITPLVYGLPNCFVLGKLGVCSLEELGEQWRNTSYLQIRALCNKVYEDICLLPEESFVNWHEMVFSTAQNDVVLSGARS
jgi:MoaA/NifB/PqqE/SkfB family radical SAM enzyme